MEWFNENRDQSFPRMKLLVTAFAAALRRAEPLFSQNLPESFHEAAARISSLEGITEENIDALMVSQVYPDLKVPSSCLWYVGRDQRSRVDLQLVWGADDRDLQVRRRTDLFFEWSNSPLGHEHRVRANTSR